MLTRTIFAASAAALAMAVGGQSAFAAPLMIEADLQSEIEEADFNPLTNTPRTLSSVDVGIGSGTELTAGNAQSDVNPNSFASWVNVDIDPATNGITVSVSDPSRTVILVDFIEVLIDNIEFDTPAVIDAIVDDTDNLADSSNPSLTFDMTAEVLPGNQILIRWEEANAFDYFNVFVDGEASFTLEVKEVVEPGSLALVATALVAGGAMGARRTRRSA